MRNRLLTLCCIATALLVPSAAQAQSRIVGGDPATPDELPWQVALLRANSGTPALNQLQCGGSILNATTILTAAHCITATSPAQVYVAAGDMDLSDDVSTAPQLRQVIGRMIHPQWVGLSTLRYDAALLKLDAPLTFDSNVQPIGLATAADMSALVPGDPLTVSGWGHTNAEDDETYTYSPSPVLRRVDVPFVADNLCAGKSDALFDAGTMFCAGDDGIDSCAGDSGGPIVRQVDGTMKLFGIVSWGVGCASIGRAGVYTRVAAPAIRDFIDPPPSTPGIAAAADKIVSARRKCGARRCSFTVTVIGPGLTAVFKRRASRKKARILKVGAPKSGVYRFKTPKLKRGRYVVILTAGTFVRTVSISLR